MASPYDAQHAAIRARIEYYATRYGILPAVGIAQIWQESRFNPRAVSSAGARGIAQFMPGTAARFGVSVYDIESSLNGWGRYMSEMLRMFNDRIDLALAGYNSGENRAEYRAAAREGRAINWAVMPARVRSETQHYVKTILANAGQGGSLSLTGSVGGSAGSGPGSSYAIGIALGVVAVGLLILE